MTFLVYKLHSCSNKKKYQEINLKSILLAYSLILDDQEE